MSEPPGPDWLVMLSGSPWRAAAHRQHALARELASTHRVLFVDPPSNAPQWSFAVTPVAPGLWHARVPTVAPLGRQLPPANRVNRMVAAAGLRRFLAAHPGRRYVWVDEDLAEPLARRLAAGPVVYDATDLDWTFTSRWNRWHLRGAMRRAVARADLVLASSAALPARLPASRRPPVVLANACDPVLFGPDGPVSDRLDGLPRPRLGYVGAVDTRAFDAPLVAAVARDHPEWTIVLAGPSTPEGRAPLRGLANVHLLGPVPYERVPEVVRGFDVAVIPYRVGGLIDYVHPKKCYEYLAVGTPVVATALPALTALGGPVRVATGPEDFARAVTAALRCGPCPVAMTLRRALARANTWPVRGEQLRRLLAAPTVPREVAA